MGVSYESLLSCRLEVTLRGRVIQRSCVCGPTGLTNSAFAPAQCLLAFSLFAFLLPHILLAAGQHVSEGIEIIYLAAHGGPAGEQLLHVPDFPWRCGTVRWGTVGRGAAGNNCVIGSCQDACVCGKRECIENIQVVWAHERESERER